MDTIFSSATGNFKSAIKIIRVSGKKSKTIPDIFFYKQTNPKEASVRKLYDKDQNLIDKAIVIYFPGPKTATGEDLYEIHIQNNTKSCLISEATLKVWDYLVFLRSLNKR